MTGPPVLQSSKSIAQAPSTKRMPLLQMWTGPPLPRGLIRFDEPLPDWPLHGFFTKVWPSPGELRAGLGS